MLRPGLRARSPGSVPGSAPACPGWDPRRLWLTQYAEDKRSVKIVGAARDGEDVSEFARRLNLSNLFFDVQLLPGKRATDEKYGLELVKFELQAKVRY